MGKLIAFILTICFVSTAFAEAKNDDIQFGRGFSAPELENLGKKPDPNYVLSFPKDHYSHDDFDIEWWYLTANLKDEAGNSYGLQWTLFRFRNPAMSEFEEAESDKKEGVLESPWNNEHFYMAHASVHSASSHWFSEKLARGNVGNAGLEQYPFKLFIDEWQWSNNLSNNEPSVNEPTVIEPTVNEPGINEPGSAGLLPATLVFNAQLINSDGTTPNQQQLNVTLNLSNTGPYILQGDKGYSIKSADGQHASHYYSAPFIQAEGKLSFSNSNISTSVTGNAWFDQEWTSQLFDSATLGWDWLSLHLDNGDKIMAFRMRLEGQPDYITGTYINAIGESQILLPNDMSLAPVESTIVGNKTLPLLWTLEIPQRDILVNIKSIKNDQWNPALVAYYEGVVAVTGSHAGKGFIELTGY
ncbi:MAG: putative secreted hydrolase [Pseudomonadales bacterium]|jgi:predicted secreted hydrolase